MTYSRSQCHNRIYNFLYSFTMELYFRDNCFESNLTFQKVTHNSGLFFFLPVRVLLNYKTPESQCSVLFCFFLNETHSNPVNVNQNQKTSECRGIYVTNLNFRYKYQLFIPWTIFARLRLWNIESRRTFLFFFLSHKGIYVEGTEWHSRDREAGRH